MTPLRDWSGVTAARLPAAALDCFAAVRHRPDVRVGIDSDGYAWVRWPAGLDADGVIAALRPAPGVEFYALRGDHWRRFGSRLPAGRTPPIDLGRPLAEVLTPIPAVPLSPTHGSFARVPAVLVRDDVPHPATALRCRLGDFAAWADLATTRQLAGVRAAASGDEVLAVGALPVVAAAVRFWGDAVKLPLGFTACPALEPDALRELVGAGADDLVFWADGGVEVVPRRAFEPATRAGVRLAWELVAEASR